MWVGVLCRARRYKAFELVAALLKDSLLRTCVQWTHACSRFPSFIEHLRGGEREGEGKGECGRLLGSNACLHGRDDYTGSNRWPSSIAASRASTYREGAGREANAFGAHNTPLVRTTPL